MFINVDDSIRFYNDPNIYEVTGVIADQERVFYYDVIAESEFEKSFDDVETFWSKAIPTHKIDGCYFPQKNEIEASWECLETGKKVSVTFAISEGRGEDFAEVILPCVYHLGTKGKVCVNAEDCGRKRENS